jgi:alpha-glucosidase
MGNHDQRRVASRLGEARTDTMNMVLLTLPGASVTYMGEEIGMTDVDISWADTVDPAACRTNETEYQKTTRDPARTPFQWDSTTSAGFSTATTPWLPVSPNYRTVNVAAQQTATKSHLKTYKQLIQLRKDAIMQSDGFSSAYYGNVLFLLRWDASTSRGLITLANFGDNVETFNYTKAAGGGLKWPSNVKLLYQIVSDKQTQSVG